MLKKLLLVSIILMSLASTFFAFADESSDHEVPCSNINGDHQDKRADSSKKSNTGVGQEDS